MASNVLDMNASLITADRGAQNQCPSSQQVCLWACNHTSVFKSLRPYGEEKEIGGFQASPYTVNNSVLKDFLFGTDFDLIVKDRKRINYAQKGNEHITQLRGLWTCQWFRACSGAPRAQFQTVFSS